jgi:hypothetical protein
MTEMTIKEHLNLVPALTDGEITEIRLALRIRIKELTELVNSSSDGYPVGVEYLAQTKSALEKIRNVY